MLNYVWSALLILGIGAALVTDITNKTENRYRNYKPLKAEIILQQKPGASPANTYNAKLNINQHDFYALYGDSISGGFSSPVKINLKKGKNEGSFFFTIDKAAPAIWQEMGKASGKDNDLTGRIYINRVVNDTLLYGGLVFEEVSFTKLKDVTNSALEYAGTAVEISLGLIGIMALWLGIMKIAEEAGLINIIARVLKPVMKRLFPDVPPEHPAIGAMVMNISANLLGLGNAATPFGLKAMEELDKLNPEKGTATNSMVTFLAINTAGLTLIPASAIAVRAASGSSDPALIIGTSLFGSACATTTAIIAAKLFEKFPFKFSSAGWWLKQNIKTVTILFAAMALLLLFFISGAFNAAAKALNPETFKNVIQVFSTAAIPFLILLFIGYGFFKKVKVYESFIEGAKDGFNVAIKIIPYLVGMLVAIGVFRAGGAMEWLIYILRPVTDFIGMPAEALPMALMRPLSGSGSLGIMAEILSVHGPDSFIGILVSTFYGSTETTFYVLAVYFGSVSIKKTRHALPAGLLADIAGILGALFIVKLLFG